MFREILEAFEEKSGLKPATMDDMVNKSSHSFSDSPLGLKDVEKVVPPEFASLYDKHKEKFYLAQIAKAIAEDMGVDATPEQLQNIQSWVYLLGHVQTVRKENSEREVSDQLKKKIAAEYVGKSVKLKIKSESVLGDFSKVVKYRVVKVPDGRIALMPPHASREGILMDSPYTIILAMEE